MHIWRLFWRLFSIFHRFFDIFVHFLFKFANFGNKEQLPPINDLLLLSPASSLAAKIRKKKLKSVDLVNAYIARIKDVNPFINAAVGNRFEQALAEAKEIDELILSGLKTEQQIERETPLLGVPFSVKEMIATEGFPYTAGLLTRKNIKATFNAQTVQLMKKAGAIPLVSTNISELGMWYESYNKVHGRTRNPYDLTRTAGGSSGGEGSLIGAAGSVIGIGSDIGGSIRIPAFFNGIFGHKPTPDVVSNYGSYPPSGEREFVPYLSLGPMCRYAIDLMTLMKILAGKNISLLELDMPVKINKLKFYYIEDVGNHVMYSKVDAELIKTLHRVLLHFEIAYNIKPKKLDLPEFRYMYPMWAAAISSCKAPSFSDELAEKKGKINFALEMLQWFFGQSRFTFPAITLGLTESFIIENNDSYLIKIKDLTQKLKDILGDDGILLFPPHPLCAPYHNEPLLKPLNFTYTAIFNVLGFPVTQCPVGLGREGLPLGTQVVANAFNDRLTLAVALEIEKAFGGWIAPCPIV